MTLQFRRTAAVVASAFAVATCTHANVRTPAGASPSSRTPSGAAPPTTARLEPQPLPFPSIAPLNALQRFRSSVDSMVNDAQFSVAHWGILIFDGERGDTLYSHNADKLFMPASNQKIITSAVAVTQLGAAYQWRTVVELRGVINAHTFVGDVVVIGRGDPSWSDAMHGGDALAAFAPVADALVARGISKIEGRIVAEGDAFSDATTGFGWAFEDFDSAYSSPIDELLFNEGFFTLAARAGQKLASTLSVTTRPTSDYPKIIVRAVARDRGDTLSGRHPLRIAWDSTGTVVEVTGTLPAGDSVNVEVPYRHPNDAALAAMTQALRNRGIRVLPPSVVRARRTPKARGGAAIRAADTLVVLLSSPLSEVLKRVDKPSQNQLAEMLYKTTALEKTGVGTADSARTIVQRQLVAWGVAADGIAVRDGSGLSRHDYVAPRTLVRVLDVMRKQPGFDAFYAALPIAGVDGTIANRMKGTPAAGNVHAKTGTVDKARSLSGYVTTADGHLLVFSLLCNNFTVPTRAVEKVQDAIAVQLASMRLRDAQAGKP
ncbi:MAG: D-alanyl-D-alanine carboxypeptidase/D-alanyl-D-alanine-endopeptidase [Gemmatimonadota bacterium]|nr:D-alanyl-D-alanine carboxypeptidase/D-alanyl-D-alanine-endopeptidase [Gemmatimonadota bacterium]